jgi:hypothetical protein
MKRLIFRREVIIIVIVLFAGTNMIPIIESISFQHRGTPDASNGASLQNTYLKNTSQPPSPLTGLPPSTKTTLKSTTGRNTHPTLPQKDEEFYAWNAYEMWGMPNGPVTFDTDAVVTLIQASGPQPPNFISGSDFDFENNWYMVGYYGDLYKCDPETGDIRFIANTIPWCTSLVVDSTTDVWYLSDPFGLYTIDIETGSTALIGLYGLSTLMISIMVDASGTMYGYDVVSSGHSTLYSIDKSTGAASPIGDMGYGFCYAQEGKFDRLGNTLYLATYDWTSCLAICDPDTAEVTLLNEFSPQGIDIDGLAIMWHWLIPGVGVNHLTTPVSGYAGIITPEVIIQNHGWDDVDNASVNLRIQKNHYLDYVNEQFDGGFPPDGWSNLASMDYWVQSNTTYAGGTAPETVLWSINNTGGTGALQSLFVDTSSAASLILSFRSVIEWAGGPCTCTVEVTGNGGATWVDVSPWVNPLILYQVPWHITINLSSCIGTQTGVRFSYSGQPSWMSYWAIDDVRIYELDKIQEYNQTVLVDVPAWEIMEVTFPQWTPTDLGISENMTMEYFVRATTQYPGNYFPHNHRERTFTLSFDYFHDVTVSCITSPQNGAPQTQPCHIILENHGQYEENVSVNMIISQASHTTVLQEDFSNGFPPSGWGTNANNLWTIAWTNYSGGIIPEAHFQKMEWYGDEYRLYTPVFDTTNWASALLTFKEYAVDGIGNGILKVQTSTDGGVSWDDAFIRAAGTYGPTKTWLTLNPANGIGSNNLMLSFTYYGAGWNKYGWFIDDVWLGSIDIIATEYNQTINVSIPPGASLNLTLPDWTPSATMDYLITASVHSQTADENQVNNILNKVVEVSSEYEHDVGVIEIIEPDDPQNPGIYFVKGRIQNLGAIFPEENILVNAIITNDTGVMIYNETEIVPGPLAPGQTDTATFPTITIPDEPTAEGDYTLSMKTMLDGDDHPENDMKTKTWIIQRLDITPPTTTATITGTMGKNDWFISNVQATLTATDGKWPSGVNHTYYNIDGGSWCEYTVPIIIDTDGYHIICYYSVDNAGNVEIVHCDTFMIDKTAPTILNYTATAQNIMKTQWLLEVSALDVTSGIAYVEFYADDAFVGNDTIEPYELLVDEWIHTTQCIVYDAAGNSEVSDIVNASDYSSPDHYFDILHLIEHWRSENLSRSTILS